MRLGFATSLLRFVISDEGGGGGGLAYLWRCAPCLFRQLCPARGEAGSSPSVALCVLPRFAPPRSWQDSKRKTRRQELNLDPSEALARSEEWA